jgi:hypothetical protein
MMFSTLRTMNPQFSKDPLVAGAYMRRMVQSPEGLGGIAGEALSHHGDFANPMGEAFGRGAQEGAKSGLGDAYRREEEGRKPDPWALEEKKLNKQHELRQSVVPFDEFTEHYDANPETGEASENPNKIIRKTTAKRPA